MACLSKERGGVYRIHWKFQIRVGPRAGETIQGSLQLGRCTKAAAKTRLRDVDDWKARARTARLVPDRKVEDIFACWLRERSLTCTPQTVERSKRVMDQYLRWRHSVDLPSQTLEQIARREELTTWRDHRLAGEAGRKTVANDLANASAFFEWCTREKYIPDNPMVRISRPRFVDPLSANGGRSVGPGHRP